VPVTPDFVDEVRDSDAEATPQQKHIFMTREAVMATVISEDDKLGQSLRVRIIEAYGKLAAEVMKTEGGREKVLAITEPLGEIFMAFLQDNPTPWRPAP
jgi:hypothetical protein